MRSQNGTSVAAVEKQALSLSTQHAGNVVQQILAANEEEKRQNREGAHSFPLLFG